MAERWLSIGDVVSLMERLGYRSIATEHSIMTFQSQRLAADIILLDVSRVEIEFDDLLEVLVAFGLPHDLVVAEAVSLGLDG